MNEVLLEDNGHMNEVLLEDNGVKFVHEIPKASRSVVVSASLLYVMLCYQC